jgi:uncharacterized membrane protein YphA (DoxX/SURF4 family)
MNANVTPNEIPNGKAAGKAGQILLWILQVVTAVLFFMAAYPKLTGSPMMVAVFEKIGLGQWFRYLTGSLEVLGGLLLLIPGLAFFGAILLSAVMVGAVATHLAILGGSPTAAAVYLVLAVLIAWFRRNQVLKGGQI